MTDETLNDAILSCAIDGEPVDVGRLRAALATDQGRRELAAFVLLRAMAAGDRTGTQPQEMRGAAALLVRHHEGLPRGALWFTSGPRVPARIAAAVTLAVTASALVLGGLWASRFGSASGSIAGRDVRSEVHATPPAVRSSAGPSDTVGQVAEERARISPGGGAQRSAGASRPASAERTDLQPPTPTRTLRFEPGIDWRAGS